MDGWMEVPQRKRQRRKWMTSSRWMDGWMDGWKCPSARGKEENDANARAPSKPSAIFFSFFPLHSFFFLFLFSHIPSLFLTCERSFS